MSEQGPQHGSDNLTRLPRCGPIIWDRAGGGLPSASDEPNHMPPPPHASASTCHLKVPAQWPQRLNPPALCGPMNSQGANKLQLLPGTASLHAHTTSCAHTQAECLAGLGWAKAEAAGTGPSPSPGRPSGPDLNPSWAGCGPWALNLTCLP